MPGLTPRDMNGHEYDRGPRGPYSGMNGSADPYREEFYRDDPYRRDDGAEEMYRRVVKNGRPMNDRFGSDYMQDQGRPLENRDVVTFEVDHLATFQSNEPNGSLQPADGLRKLRYMENNAGIWTMRCIMSIERKFLVILDYSTGEELERFPITMVQDPTAIFKNDKREIYNNLILFSVMERRNAPTDMHIFQAISCPIGRCELKNQAQEIVDEILAAKEGRPRISGHRIPPPPLGPAPEPPGHARDAYEFREYRAMGGAGFIGGGPPRNVINRTRDSDGLIANEVLERDVQLLNHCFDDVEKFVARLQQAAEAYRELEKRKKDRKGRKKQPGEGMLSHRARPPPANDFIDIFRKFKLSFNLLAKLKAHIHDPNAPELVHFLFTPLSLIYEASRDPVHGNQNLADQAVAPVLTAEAKQLLLNCLTSKEQDMWQNLGRNWTTSREEWKGPVPQYSPQFYDGWIPPRMVDDVITTPRTDPGLEPAVMAHGAHMRARSMEVIEKRSFPHEEERFGMDGRYSDSRFDDFRRNDFDRTPRPPSPRNPIPVSQPRVPVYPEYTEQRSYPRQEPSPTPAAPRPRNRQEENQAFALRLKQKGAEVHEVLHDRQGKNAKELTVQKGDVLEVLDRSRNWWKVRNYRDEEGFAPYTILKELKSQELEERLPGQGEPRDRSSGVYTTQLLERSSGVYNTHIQERHTPPIAVPAPPPAPSPTAALLASEAAGRRNQRRGDFRYF